MYDALMQVAALAARTRRHAPAWQSSTPAAPHPDRRDVTMPEVAQLRARLGGNDLPLLPRPRFPGE